MNQFFMQFINGLNIGSIYALIALGYTMVYGIAKLINFAHGDVIMVGAYISFISMKFGLPWWLAVIISIVACAILGVVMEKVAYKPLRKASRISLLITAIGISYLLQNAFQLIFGANPQPYHAFITLPALNLGGISILPMVASALWNLPRGLMLGGTNLLIVVGVALELSRQIEGRTIKRKYKGFIEE